MAESRGAAIVKKAEVKEQRTDLVKSKRKVLNDLVKSMEPQIAKALPSVITPDRFSRIVLSAISTNPKLAECDANSFLGSMMTAAQLGLEPNTPTGQAYLIPYGNVCQFQLGYKGLINLFYRDPNAQSIEAHVVYENDVFEYELGLDAKLRHVPARRDRGEAIAYYAIFRTKSGGYGFEVMSMEDIEAHRRRFSKAKNSPWDTNFDEMAKKTVIKRVLKYAPISSDLMHAIAYDENARNINPADANDDVIEYIDITDESAEDNES